MNNRQCLLLSTSLGFGPAAVRAASSHLCYAHTRTQCTYDVNRVRSPQHNHRQLYPREPSISVYACGFGTRACERACFCMYGVHVSSRHNTPPPAHIGNLHACVRTRARRVSRPCVCSACSSVAILLATASGFSCRLPVKWFASSPRARELCV